MMDERMKASDYGITRSNIDHIVSLEHIIESRNFNIGDINALTEAYGVA